MLYTTLKAEYDFITLIFASAELRKYFALSIYISALLGEGQYKPN